VAKKKQAAVEKRIRLTDEDWRRNKITRDNAPQVLTDKLIQQFADEIEEWGCSARLACDFLGISYVSFWKWVNRGQIYIEGDQEPVRDAIYGRFYQACRRAFAGYIRRFSSQIQMPTDYWRRDLAILVRRDPETWGKTQQQDAITEQYEPNKSFL